MRFHLEVEPNFDYQMQAIEAVYDLLRGQKVCRTEFTVTMKLSMSRSGSRRRNSPAIRLGRAVFHHRRAAV